MPRIVTSQGDSIPSLAADHGHFSDKIWNHPENAALKALRKNPNVLAPGDEVFIPELEVREESRGTDSRHKFKRKGVPEMLRIQLFLLNEPRANEDYTLMLDDKIITGKTDGDGRIETPIPPNCRGGKLILGGGKEEYPVNIGHLNPIDLISGVKQRLNNLGYFCGGEGDDLDEQSRKAISQFQGDQGLERTGEIDDATRSKLQSLHE